MVLVALAVVVGVVRAEQAPRRGAGPAAQSARAGVRSIALPAAAHFSALKVVGNELRLSGGPQESVASKGYGGRLVDGRVPGTCDAVDVNPRTLALGQVMRANCGDPTLYGERVLPISYWLGAAATNSYDDMAVRIAIADPAARDGYRLGPIVTTYQKCSDCEISWIIGDGSLWVYNPLAEHHKSLGELLRISTLTGAVLERWTMPTILQALLATDADGLWLSPSVGGGVRDVERSKLAAYESLYRVTPNDPTPKRVFTEGAGAARWLVASGEVAAAAIDKPDGYSTIWMFTGGHTRAHGPTVSDSPMGTDEWGVDNPVVAGNNRLGYLSVVDTKDTESVVQVKPDSQRERVIARFHSRYAADSYAPPSVVTLDGSLFYIDPATNTGRELRRVTPS